DRGLLSGLLGELRGLRLGDVGGGLRRGGRDGRNGRDRHGGGRRGGRRRDGDLLVRLGLGRGGLRLGGLLARHTLHQDLVLHAQPPQVLGLLLRRPRRLVAVEDDGLVGRERERRGGQALDQRDAVREALLDALVDLVGR